MIKIKNKNLTKFLNPNEFTLRELNKIYKVYTKAGYEVSRV